jgi:hypothetical protein
MTNQGNQAMEYHVAKHGADDQAGTFSAPFKTIMAAARVALPGDTITIHPEKLLEMKITLKKEVAALLKDSHIWK